MDDEEYNPEFSSRAVLVAVMVCLIVVAHVFMWFSDMPQDLKITFTILNIVGWTIVLMPILLVDKWLNAIQNRNNDE
ncbi:phenylalanyl-tRNA synthetase subunit beta [Roseobacter sp.]|uniref:phenylalanyl-tRNA synthetase subunit beta n=1 Tax=Roseobacter sp. TaxID=1907202 RepID=UPI0038589948